MKINVYKEEQTEEVLFIEQEAKTGTPYLGIAFIMLSPKELHHEGADDDRSAVTFWGSSREELIQLLMRAVHRLQDSK